MDRIDYEPHNLYLVDDAVLEATSVHIEDMGDRIWIGIERPSGERFAFEVSARLDYDWDIRVDCIHTEGVLLK